MGAEFRIGDEPEDELIGTLVAGRYLILELLGEGGMARVYVARHVHLDKRVALKVLAPKSHVPQAAERFLREARTMADLDHPNVVGVTDFGETDDGLLYLVMEYVDGEDLATTLVCSGPMPWPRVKHIVLQIARGLGRAHENGVIHRDVKPDNILRVAGEADEDFVKVLDFGIAHVTRSSSTGRLTRTGAVFGTPEYMAPEQQRTGKIDHRVDIYALGIIAYELLTGDVPFTADDFMEVLWQHANVELSPPSHIVPDVSNAADAFILMACAKDPNRRFQTMEELVDFIESGTVVYPRGFIPLESPDKTVVAKRAPLPVQQEVTPSPVQHDLTPLPHDPSSPISVSVSSSGPVTLPAAISHEAGTSFGSGGGTQISLSGSNTGPRPVVAETQSGWLVFGGVLAGVLIAGVAFAVMLGTSDDDAPDDSPATPVAVVTEEVPPEPAPVPAQPEPPPAMDPDPEPEPEPAVEPEPEPEGTTPPKANADPLPKRARRSALAKVRPGVNACRGSVFGGKPGDVIRVRITVNSAGKVTSARPQGAHAASALGKCVAAAAKRAKFPAFQGKPISFNHPFRL